MARIGIYSGTFDPVHTGHTKFALAAADSCVLDTVLFAPEPKPRNKQYVTDIDYRLDMVQLATQNHDRLDIVKLPFDQFTVPHTLPMIQSMFPAAELTFLVGSDVALSFDKGWDQLPKLLDIMELAVGLRHNHTAQEVQLMLQKLGLQARVTFVQGDNGASSDIRSGDAQYLLDPKVAAYAAMHNLY